MKRPRIAPGPSSCELSEASRQIALHVGGQDHLVDDVDDTVRCLDVSGGDVRVVDHHAIVEVDCDLTALYGGGFHVVHKIGGHHCAGHDVIGQNRDQLLFVLRQEQAFDRACGQGGKGLIGGGEHGERAFGFQCVH